MCFCDMSKQKISSLQFWLENQHENWLELKLVFMPIFFPLELTPRGCPRDPHCGWTDGRMAGQMQISLAAASKAPGMHARTHEML